MNRVFVFLVVAGAVCALGLDLFGGPLEVAPGAVVHAPTGARVRALRTEGARRGLRFKVEKKSDREVVLRAGEDAFRARVQDFQGPGKRQTLAFADARVEIELESSTGTTSAVQIVEGLARLGTLRVGDAPAAPHLARVTEGMLDMAGVAAKLALGLIGILALWMGVLRVAEAAGLVQALARLLRPLMRRLFPEIPEDHPAMGAMVMNIAANMLGLGNAATPLGLEAMRQLQTLNTHRRTATNAMCLFLAINTSGLTLIPTRVVALRAESGSDAATAIVLPTLLATFASTVVAIFVARLFAATSAPVVEDVPLPEDARGVADAEEVRAPPEEERAPGEEPAPEKETP